MKGSQEKKAHNEGELQFPLPISLELPPRGVSPSSFPSLPLAFLCLAHLPVLLGSCVKWPPSECCNLSVMPWILSTKLLRACAWLCASEESPPLPPMLHCGISSAMLLMFGMEPNYHSEGSGGEKEKVRNVLQLLSCDSTRLHSWFREGHAPCPHARPLARPRHEHDSGNG